MRQSNQKVQYYSLAVFLSVLMIVLTFFLLHNSISCVDENGCLYEHCVDRRFNKDFTKIIKMSQTDECRFKLK